MQLIVLIKKMRIMSFSPITDLITVLWHPPKHIVEAFVSMYNVPAEEVTA